MYFPLATDGRAILLTGDTQENIGTDMLESHAIIALPVNTITLHCPNIQVITLAILSECTDLLQREQLQELSSTKCKYLSIRYLTTL